MSILETISTPVGSYAPDFELPGTDNQVHHLRRYLDKFGVVAVISMCNECNYVDVYIERLKNIQLAWRESGFTLIGVNGSDASANPKESFDCMKAFSISRDLNFPYLWDSTQDVTRGFGANTTPTAFLIDSNGVVRYKGQIDDRPLNADSVKQNYLPDAIACLLAGKDICIPQTKPIGTYLVWRN